MSFLAREYAKFGDYKEKEYKIMADEKSIFKEKNANAIQVFVRIFCQ
jgi:hypothetical protein